MISGTRYMTTGTRHNQRKTTSKSKLSSEFPFPIVQTKLFQPQLTDDLIPRQRLIQKLNQDMSKPLTLVIASAGYGKSTIVSQWLAQTKYKNGWVQLSETENDLQSFLGYLIEATQKAFPKIKLKTKAMISATEAPPIATIAGYLNNDLSQINQKFVLVLDDFQYIKNQSIHELVSVFLSLPPSKLNLVIISRIYPSFKTGSLRAKSQLKEIRLKDLRFTVSETQELLNQADDVNVTQAIAASVRKQTEGWITALKLSTLTSSDLNKLTMNFRGVNINNQNIQSYLIEEVLDSLSEEVIDVLIKFSLLERFNQDLCQLLCCNDGKIEITSHNCKQMILNLKQRGFFIFSLDDEDNWFRYHHLFQELLRNILVSRFSSQQINQLHMTYSRWFEEQGMMIEAFDHAMAGSDVNAVIELIKKNRIQMLNEDKWLVISHWISMIPVTLIEQSLELLLTKAWICFYHLDFGQLIYLTQKMMKVADEKTTKQELIGEISFFLGYFKYFQSEGKEAEKYFSNAIKKIPGSFHQIRGEVDLHYALSLHMNGKGDQAKKELKDLISRQPDAPLVRSARWWAALSFIKMHQANLFRASFSAEQISQILQSGSYYYLDSWGQYLQSIASFFQFDYKKSKEIFNTLIDNPYPLHSRAAIDAMAGAVIIHQHFNHPKMADEAMESLENFAMFSKKFNYDSIAYSMKARLALMRGDIARAIHEFKSVDLDSDAGIMLWWIEIPRITRCRVLVATGVEAEVSLAVKNLKMYLAENRSQNNSFQMIIIQTILSIGYSQLGKSKLAKESLIEAIRLGKEGGWIQPYIELGEPMKKMLSITSFDKADQDYVNQIFKVFASQKVDLKSIYEKEFIDPLTTKELEILQLLAKRLSYKECAKRLTVSPNTTKKHAVNLYQKLQVHSRDEAVNKAKDIGIL